MRAYHRHWWRDFLFIKIDEVGLQCAVLSERIFEASYFLASLAVPVRLVIPYFLRRGVQPFRRWHVFRIGARGVIPEQHLNFPACLFRAAFFLSSWIDSLWAASCHIN